MSMFLNAFEFTSEDIVTILSDNAGAYKARL